MMKFCEDDLYCIDKLEDRADLVQGGAKVDLCDEIL